MTFDRSEFEKTITKKGDDRVREMIPLLRVVQSAAPAMQKMMTQDDTWNRYLSYLQGFVDKANDRKKRAESEFANPLSAWEGQQLAKLKSDIIAASAMIEAWSVAMELPKMLMENGGNAREIIEKFDKDHENTAEKTLP